MLGGIVAIVLVLVIIVALLLNGQTQAGASQAPAQEASVQAPTNLSAFISNGALVLSWQPAHPAPDGYRVYRSSGQRGPYALIGTISAPDIDTFTDESNLTPDTTYAYKVTAINGPNESAAAGPAIVVVAPRNMGGRVLPSPTIPPPRPVPTFDASNNAIPVVGEGTAGPAPTPLPTFRALTPAELTAIAREPKRRATPRTAPYSGLGALTPTATPFATPATTVGPVATPTSIGPAVTPTSIGPATTPTPSAIGANTPGATPTVITSAVTVTATPTPTPTP